MNLVASRPLEIVFNQKGVLTVDFLFAFVLIMGFTVILFALSLTLTVAEITQYITFASARSVMTAHHSRDDQRDIGTRKFEQLISHPDLRIFFEGKWFELGPPEIGDRADVIPEYKSQAQGPSLFFGTVTSFTARILDFQIPFYGSTAPQGDGTGSGFRTDIGSYLSREVNSDECLLNFVRARWVQIRNLPVQGAAPYSTSTEENTYVAMADNGC